MYRSKLASEFNHRFPFVNDLVRVRERHLRHWLFVSVPHRDFAAELSRHRWSLRTHALSDEQRRYRVLAETPASAQVRISIANTFALRSSYSIRTIHACVSRVPPFPHVTHGHVSSNNGMHVSDH